MAKLKRKRIQFTVLVVLSIMLVCLVSCSGRMRKDLETEKANEPEVIYVYVTPEPEANEVSDEHRLEAEQVAKVLYGTARYNTDAGKKMVVWCIINRVQSTVYANTVSEVCSQDKQWMQYSDDNPVLTDLYDLALEQLMIWHENGHRPIGPDFLFLSWSSDEIILRTTFEEKASTKYFRETDFKE